MLRDKRVERCVPGDLIVPQHRIKPLGIEIMEIYPITVTGKRLNHGVSNGVIETSRAGMGKNDRDRHGSTVPIPLKNV